MDNPIENRRFLFVGERRSPTAIEKGWSWQGCQEDGQPRLCAIQLFAALQRIGLDPLNQEKVRFINLFEDGRDQLIPERVGAISELGGEWTVVGMGQRVQRALTENAIAHLPLVHPAARGKIRNQERYAQHVRAILLERK